MKHRIARGALPNNLLDDLQPIKRPTLTGFLQPARALWTAVPDEPSK
jgi:hypothetical protein